MLITKYDQAMMEGIKNSGKSRGYFGEGNVYFLSGQLWSPMALWGNSYILKIKTELEQNKAKKENYNSEEIASVSDRNIVIGMEIDPFDVGEILNDLNTGRLDSTELLAEGWMFKNIANKAHVRLSSTRERELFSEKNIDATKDNVSVGVVENKEASLASLENQEHTSLSVVNGSTDEVSPAVSISPSEAANGIPVVVREHEAASGNKTNATDIGNKQASVGISTEGVAGAARLCTKSRLWHI